MSKGYREECEEIIDKWSKFRRGLRGDERDRWDKLMDMARKHKTAGDKQNNPRPIDTFFTSILLEQQMKIYRLEGQLKKEGIGVDQY